MMFEWDFWTIPDPQEPLFVCIACGQEADLYGDPFVDEPTENRFWCKNCFDAYKGIKRKFIY